MKATINLHDVTSIRVGEMQQLGGEKHYRDIEIKTSDGDVFVIAAYTIGESAEIAVADRQESPEEYTGSADSLKEALDRSMPDGVQTHDDGWIRHDGGECLVHPMDVVETDVQGTTAKGTAHTFYWGRDVLDLAITHYRPLRDENGVPYCSADGLEDWAEYVATDADGECHQYEGKIDRDEEEWLGERHLTAPGRYINTRQHWTETLRRVWRQ